MITKEQKRELGLIKPRNYRELVKNYLESKGYNYSTETITKVYNGKRTNDTIEVAIAVVFNKEKQKKDRLKEDKNQVQIIES